jgi:hypothetical protein
MQRCKEQRERKRECVREEMREGVDMFQHAWKDRIYHGSTSQHTTDSDGCQQCSPGVTLLPSNHCQLCLALLSVVHCVASNFQKLFVGSFPSLPGVAATLEQRQVLRSKVLSIDITFWHSKSSIVLVMQWWCSGGERRRRTVNEVLFESDQWGNIEAKSSFSVEYV